ncbi:hypothetical protein EYH65_05915 [Bacillus subtilis]|nr:hypothetical protein [Bacillus subtilis]
MLEPTFLKSKEAIKAKTTTTNPPQKKSASSKRKNGKPSKKKTSSPKTAKLASKVLRDGSYSKDSKTLAGSVLAQSRGK